MNGQKPHHLWQKLSIIKPWQLFVACALSGTVCVFALRGNNQTMIKLRNAVYQADQQNGNVEESLQTLRSYVYAHMNTNLVSSADAVYPPIQLKYTYQRLQQAEQQHVNTLSSQIYTDAQNYCQQLDPVSFSGRTRVPCIESYVQSHRAKVQPISPALYEFDFVSPSWSPDLAGWSLIATISLATLWVINLSVRFLLPRLAKRSR